MKLRHAAALALVGWYLMVPPRDGDSTLFAAPLYQWEIVGSGAYRVHSTMAACEEYRTYLPEEMAAQYRFAEMRTRSKATKAAQQIRSGECIEDTNPRLKSPSS